jgi:DNA-directed RNA polymerase specialized sigma24 family protein
MKLSDQQAKRAMEIAFDQTRRFGPTTLGNEDYAMTAVEQLLLQEKEPPNIEAWIRLVVTNMMIDRSRKLKARKPSMRGLEPEVLDSMLNGSRIRSISSLIANQDLVADLLDQLNEKDQRLLILDAAGFATKEIAEELGYANAKVVATRMKQIRNKLKSQILNQGSR